MSTRHTVECHRNTSSASSRVFKRSPAWASGLSFPSFYDPLLPHDMALGLCLRLHALSTIFLFISLTLSTSPSTNTPVPPFQWIELTNLLSGPPPPGLKYATIGFDDVSSSILIFGGESNGFPEQQTYLCAQFTSLAQSLTITELCATV